MGAPGTQVSRQQAASQNWQAFRAEWLPKTWSTRFLSSPFAAGIEGCGDAGWSSQGYEIYMFYFLKWQ